MIKLQIISLFCVVTGIGLLMPFFSFAAENTFIVSQSINGDVTPPTTPSIVSVIPVSFSQIDVSWSSSTDDIYMGGYQVFRDAVQVATTTLLSYSDTGLTPSTTYSYSVRAFDVPRNLSTTSAAVATTTLGLPATTTPTTTPPTSSGNSGRLDVELLLLDIETSVREAYIDWETNLYTRYSLRWGRTSNYELGYVTTDVYSRIHSTRITDLEPGTVYEYELIAHDRNGDNHLLSRSRFTTEEAIDLTAPPNVSDLKAVVEGSDVRLTWFNPPVDDLGYIRVVRSNLFYPNDPNAGYIVYQGGEEEVLDMDAFKSGAVQYYTAFAYDRSGNVSSGAVVAVLRPGSSSGLASSDEEEVEVPLSTSTINILEELEFDDFEVIQDGKILTQTYNNSLVDGSKPITIRIPYEALPEHLKTVTVTFTHPDDKSLTFSFLLRVNKDKTAYEAVIAPFYEDGFFEMSISVFDYKAKVMKEVQGSLSAEYETPGAQKKITSPLSLQLIVQIFLLLFLLLLLILFLLLVKRKNSGED